MDKVELEKHVIEKYAMKIALGNNGGGWATHYNEDQKNYWRKLVTELFEELKELESLQKEGKDAYEKTCEEFWDKLSYDDKLKAFYSVVKRIHQAELVDRGSYRWALYDVFGFDMDAYGIGMECGYMELHNSIYTKEEIEELKKS